MSLLVVVRHGQAEGNSTHRLIGQSQVPLTETGRHQAELVADRLERLGVSRIVTSDLVRCVETVEPLAGRIGVVPETTPSLREIDNGAWTGLEPAEIEARWPEMWKAYVEGDDVARPDGERWSDVAARVVPVAERLLSDDGTVAVCTHGGPTLILALWAAGIAPRGNIFRGRLGSLDNASLTTIQSGPRLVAFNDVGHLAGDGPDTSLPFESV